MDNTNASRQKLIDFADKYLFPYKIRSKIQGSEEIVPELCPFCGGGSHGDRETFALSIDKGVYVCKRGSCGVTGVFSQLAEHFGDGTAVDFGHRRGGINQEKTYSLPNVELKPATEEIYKYFESRKIPRDVVDAFKVGSDEHGNIVFPFYDEKNVLTYVKYRKPRKPQPGEPKEWAAPNTKSILFNLQNISFKQPVIISEGLVDTMSLYTAGLHNVVSVPSGCSNLDWIENNWSWLEKVQQFVLFGDNDTPGKEMVARVVRRLGEDRCKVVTDYPMRPDGVTPTKDANEILYFHGEMELLNMALNAQEIPVHGAVDMGDVVPVDPTLIPRIKTGIPMLDRMTGGLPEGSVFCLYGKSGSGKSIVSNLIAVNALQQGYSVFIYSGEFKIEQLQEWMHQQIAGSEYISLKYDPIRDEEVPFIPYQTNERIRQWYKGRLFAYSDDAVDLTQRQSDDLLRVAVSMIRRHGVKLIVIDNLMTVVSDREDETSAQREFANQLKKLAKKHGVAILLVCHARKTIGNGKLGKDDVSGSSAVMNLASVAVAVQPGEMDITKNRETGICKTIQFCYCPDSRRIYQADQGDKLHFDWDRTGIPLANPRADSRKEYQVVPPKVYDSPF